MNKTRNWVRGAAAAMLVMVLLAVLLLQFINNARVSSFRPLQDDLLRQIAVNPQSAGDTTTESRLEKSQGHSSKQSESPEAGTATSGGQPVAARGLTSLARPLNRDDLMREFRPGTNPVENAYKRLLGSGLKIKDSLSWAAGAADNGNTALEIGTAAMNRGDIDEARDYLRAALDANIRSGDLSLRQAICGQLAWVEEYPEVAAALLEASCTAARTIDEEFMAFHIQDALALAILTGSNELAEHYYARWDELEPGAKPIVNPLIERGGSEGIESWLDEHHPDFYETATRWDPTRKREEDGTKQVG